MQVSMYMEYPEFRPHSILKSSHLVALRNSIYGVINAHYMDYSEGIIKGFEPKVIKDYLVFSKGVLKVNSQVFWTSDNTMIKLPTTEGSYYVYANIEKNLEDEKIFCNISIENLKTNKIELCRFHIRDGAILNDYDTYLFLNDSVKYNTINLEYSKIANKYNVDILHYKLLEKWFDKMKLLQLSKIDLDFINTLLHTNFRVHSLTLYSYILEKTGVKVENNYEALNELTKIVNNYDENEYFE